MVPVSLIGAPVGHRAFRVLVALLAHADVDGLCHPSNNRLADLTGLDRRNVIHALNDLADANLIEVHTQNRDRVIRILGGVKATLSDNRKGSVKTTPKVVSQRHQGSVKTATPLVSKQPPTLEQTREQTISPPPSGADGVTLTLSPDADLAGRVVAEVFGLTDTDGTPDWDAAGMLRQWIAGYSERAVLAAAHKARREAKGDPLRFFVGMCRNGLEEPPGASPGPTGGASSAPPRYETPTQRQRREWKEKLEIEKAKLRGEIA